MNFTVVLRQLAFGLLLVFMGCTSTDTIEFYVSPSGNDDHPGTRNAPFRSLAQAQLAVREKLKDQPTTSFIVNVQGGKYHLEQPFILTEDDSGREEAPVIYRAVKGEVPIFTGSVEIRNWKKLEEAELLGLLPETSRGAVWVADVTEAGLTNFGDATTLGKRPELFCDGQLQTLARWPNEGFVRAGKVKGGTLKPQDYLKRQGTVEGIFEYIDQRLNRWANENDVHFGGYWYWDWADAFQRLDKIDTLSRTIFLREPFHHYGYRDSLRFFGLNLFSEIDAPGEWYLDRANGQLFWYPPEGKNPNEASVTISVFDAPFMVEVQNGSHIQLEGLTFQEGRGSAISVTGGANCRITHCRIERFGRDGIHIIDGTDHHIVGCFLRTFGHGGIKIKGGDRKTLTPARHLIENTVVEHFSLFKRTYEPAVHMDGCGTTVRNNRFRFSSSSAMRIEGNDFLVEYNEISHVVKESDDQGGLDMFYNPAYRGNIIRYNRWSDIRGGTVHGAAGVRLDDMISGVLIHGNIFERCGALHFGGVQIHGGKDNVVTNNLFYDCFAAISFSPWGEKRWTDQLESAVIRKKIFEDVDIRSELYQSRYPELSQLAVNPDVNTLKNNLIVDCEHDFLRDNGLQLMENNTSLTSNGKDVTYFCSGEVLKTYQMEPIPIDRIGPKRNPWLVK